MAYSTCLKHPLCVEWTTELPVAHAPRQSPSITLEGSDWFLELRWVPSSKAYDMMLCHMKSANATLNESVHVTTFVHQDSIRIPVLVDRRSVFKSHTPLWNKSRTDVVSQLPEVYVTCKFTIVCVFNSTETRMAKSISSTQTTARLQTLSSDFSTFLKDETFSDVKLICGDRALSAHKCILAARSEVFAAMFRNKMAEAKAGVIHIKDMDLEVLQLLLEYVYSGEMPDMSESTVRRLYKAANMYAVHSLRDACSDWMAEHQTLENCLDLLVLADEHSDKKFVEAVVCFAAKHFSSLRRKSWSTFKENYPLLAVLVCEKRLADFLPFVASHWIG